jgi:hypothetical protein
MAKMVESQKAYYYALDEETKRRKYGGQIMNNKSQQIADIMYELEMLKEELDGLVEGTENEAHYKAYGRYGFDQLLGNGNPYDESLQTIIDSLSKEVA